MNHWAVHRILAHIAITLLALLLERIAEHACEETWLTIREDLEKSHLRNCCGQLAPNHKSRSRVQTPANA